MTEAVFIDTQLWVYSKKKPARAHFPDQERYDKALKAHEEALMFFKGLLEKPVVIYTTTHQICELYHALSFRGYRIPAIKSSEFIEKLTESDNVNVFDISWPDFVEALNRSKKSQIHIWDYLCVVPIKDDIKIAYTNDQHFKDETFNNLGFAIINPLSTWEKS